MARVLCGDFLDGLEVKVTKDDLSHLRVFTLNQNGETQMLSDYAETKKGEAWIKELAGRAEPIDGFLIGVGRPDSHEIVLVDGLHRACAWTLQGHLFPVRIAVIRTKNRTPLEGK